MKAIYNAIMFGYTTTLLGKRVFQEGLRGTYLSWEESQQIERLMWENLCDDIFEW